MKPIRTNTTNCILTGMASGAMDLPVTRLELGGLPVVQSCWQLSEEELRKIAETGIIYFSSYGITHPPICISVEPIVEEVDK